MAWQRSRLYTAWCNMKGRCYRKSMKGYENYGGRGIIVCEEWRKSFPAFRDWAIANGYDENAEARQCTLDRIDVNGNYEPSNCRWISNRDQQNNRKHNRIISYNGESKTLAEWSEILGIGYKTLQKRIEKWGVEVAFETPILSREQVSGSRYKRARPVLQYSMDGEFIRRWPCINDACRELGYCGENISENCKKKTSQAHEFVWCYEGETPIFNFSGRIRAVLQYKENGTLIAQYKSFREAAEKTGFNQNSLRTAYHQSGGKYKGFIWKVERYGDYD